MQSHIHASQTWVQMSTLVHPRWQPPLSSQPTLHDDDPSHRTSHPPLPQSAWHPVAGPHSISTSPEPPSTVHLDPFLQTTWHPPLSQSASQEAFIPHSSFTPPEPPLTEQLDPCSHTTLQAPEPHEKLQSSPAAQVHVCPAPHSSEQPAMESRQATAPNTASAVKRRTVGATRMSPS